LDGLAPRGGTPVTHDSKKSSTKLSSTLTFQLSGGTGIWEQNRAFNDGNSRNRWPTSKHNKYPAKAFDIVPYPGEYEASYERFFELATYILAAASARGIAIEWGGHWKNYTGQGDNDRDWAHFEKID